MNNSTSTKLDDNAIRGAMGAAEEVASLPEAAVYVYPHLDPVALTGIAGEFVRLISPASEAGPAALLIQSLVVAGCALGRTACYEVEDAFHFTNLFVVGVGPTAAGRKGVGWARVKRPFDASGVLPPENIKAGLSSGEGIIHAVRDPVTEMRPARGKEKSGYEDTVVDQGVNDKRLLLYAPEFSQALKVAARETNILSEVIRQAWETGDLRILNKNSPEVATGAHISIVAHISKQELLTLITDSDIVNGFANRFLWYCTRRSKELPFGGNVDRLRWNKFVDHLRDAIERGRKIDRVVWAAETRDMWAKVYPALSAPKPGLLGAVISRAEAQVVRLATLYATLRGVGEIAPGDLTAALAVWQYCEDSARYIFGNRMGNPVADRILEALRASAEGLTRTEISALLGRNILSATIETALTTLSGESLAEQVDEPTGGRPAARWRAVRVGADTR